MNQSLLNKPTGKLLQTRQLHQRDDRHRQAPAMRGNVRLIRSRWKRTHLLICRRELRPNNDLPVLADVTDAEIGLCSDAAWADGQREVDTQGGATDT